MSLIAKSEGNTQIELLPEGVHTAVCTQLIDLGVQYSEKFDKSARKVLITWELPNETFETQEGETKNRMVWKEYTLSLGDKANLRKDLQAWRGKAFTEDELKGFDLNNILGVGCQIQIIHTKKGDNTYANIASIMGLPKGMQMDKPNNLLSFDLDDNNDYAVKFDGFPQWIKDKIFASTTWKELYEAPLMEDVGYSDADDGLPLPDGKMPF
ncbi:MAG: phage replication initiation protein, NGO0469 family [Syntrophothermus sp.]